MLLFRKNQLLLLLLLLYVVVAALTAAVANATRLPVPSTGASFSSSRTASTSRKPAFAVPDEPSSASASAAVLAVPRGGAMSIDADAYIKATQIFYGVYSLIMLLIPGQMVTLHFDEPAPNTMCKFWIRGSAAGYAVLTYLLGQIDDAATVVKACIVLNVAGGVLYAWNAKFGYLLQGDSFKAKKTHLFPELAFLALSIAGFFALPGAAAPVGE